MAEEKCILVLGSLKIACQAAAPMVAEPTPLVDPVYGALIFGLLLITVWALATRRPAIEYECADCDDSEGTSQPSPKMKMRNVDGRLKLATAKKRAMSDWRYALESAACALPWREPLTHIIHHDTWILPPADHHFFAWVKWSPPIGSPCADTLHRCFPGALPGPAVLRRSAAALTDGFGFSPENTIYGQSICPDEINNEKGDLASIMSDFWARATPRATSSAAPRTHTLTPPRPSHQSQPPPASTLKRKLQPRPLILFSPSRAHPTVRSTSRQKPHLPRASPYLNPPLRHYCETPPRPHPYRVSVFLWEALAVLRSLA